MPRKERPLDAGDSALLTFARELRSLRERAGSPTYRQLSSVTHYSEAALSQAAAGRKLPTLQVTLAYVRACGGSDEEWERRWHAAAAAETPDGSRLASGSGDFSARIWDVAQRRVTTHLTGQTHAVKTVAFSPDGKLLATGGTDFAVRVWDAATGTLTAELTGHTDTVHAVAFSPDGATLASASADHDVRLWRVADRTPFATLSGHTERVYALTFLPDGHTLLSAGGDRTVRAWEADAEHAAGRVCATVSPLLSAPDWNRHFPDIDLTPPCPR